MVRIQPERLINITRSHGDEVRSWGGGSVFRVALTEPWSVGDKRSLFCFAESVALAMAGVVALEVRVDCCSVSILTFSKDTDVLLRNLVWKTSSISVYFLTVSSSTL